jgi:hypothetical protein
MDIETGRIQIIARHSYPINAAEINKDKGLLCTVGDSKKVKILDLKNATGIPRGPIL